MALRQLFQQRRATKVRKQVAIAIHPQATIKDSSKRYLAASEAEEEGRHKTLVNEARTKLRPNMYPNL